MCLKCFLSWKKFGNGFGRCFAKIDFEGFWRLSEILQEFGDCVRERVLDGFYNGSGVFVM